jgi:hypothetical protein
MQICLFGTSTWLPKCMGMALIHKLRNKHCSNEGSPSWFTKLIQQDKLSIRFTRRAQRERRGPIECITHHVGVTTV